MKVAALILAVFSLITGLAGIVVPAIPGSLLIWIGFLLYGIATEFARVTPGFLAATFILVIVSFGVDYIAGIIGARRYGASGAGVWGSVVGGLLGVFAFGPVGLFLGPFVGAVIGEALAGRSLEQAFRSGLGSVIGLVGGTIFKGLVSLTMFVMFVFKALV